MDFSYTRNLSIKQQTVIITALSPGNTLSRSFIGGQGTWRFSSQLITGCQYNYYTAAGAWFLFSSLLTVSPIREQFSEGYLMLITWIRIILLVGRFTTPTSMIHFNVFCKLLPSLLFLDPQQGEGWISLTLVIEPFLVFSLWGSRSVGYFQKGLGGGFISQCYIILCWDLSGSQKRQKSGRGFQNIFEQKILSIDRHTTDTSPQS